MALQRGYFCQNILKCFSSNFHGGCSGTLRITPKVKIELPITFIYNQLSTTSMKFSQKKLEKPGFKITKVATEEGVVEVKKKLYQVRVTLVTPENDLQVLTLEEAIKIADRRNLKLFKVTERDPKNGRATYKLLTIAEYATESKKKRPQKDADAKEEKLLNINSNIATNDLQSKINHILKWLQKGYSIRVVISGDSQNYTPTENVFNVISEAVKDLGRIVQKISKYGEIKFSIIQPKKVKTKPEDNVDN